MCLVTFVVGGVRSPHEFNYYSVLLSFRMRCDCLGLYILKKKIKEEHKVQATAYTTAMPQPRKKSAIKRGKHVFIGVSVLCALSRPS